MLITKTLLESHRACEPGMTWFLTRFPEEPHSEGVEYQTVLDALAAAGEVGYAQWLVSKIGSDGSVTRLESFTGSHLFVAGSLEVAEGVTLTGSLVVAGSLVAGWSIKAGESIKAGRYIDAGESIKAGEGYSVTEGGKS